MLERRQLLQLAGVAALAGAGGAAWVAYGPHRANAQSGAAFKNYPFDPVLACGPGRVWIRFQ